MKASVQSVWSNCLERISDVVPQYSYNTWIRPLRPVSIEETDRQVLCVEVPNVFHQKWVEDNYFDIVGNTVREVLGPQAMIQLSLPLSPDSDSRYECEPPAPPQPVLPQAAPSRPPRASSPPSRPLIQRQENEANQWSGGFQLNEHYTFDELVEGDGNRLAKSAAMAVAGDPGSTSFNPLFIYGDVGLGKTHLAQAICAHAVEHHTAKNPLYITIDNFTNQFISAIRANRCPEFTNYYRQVDLLIVDDIQFLSGKERTQEEFFHLFNAIHQAGGQIVLCADRAPGDIPGIHNRLISRFHWGLTTDISPPDFETRVAILLQKSKRYHLSLDEQIAQTIAQTVSKNVRELESVLTKLLAYCSLHKTPVTHHLTEHILEQYGQIRTQVTLDEIISFVADVFEVSTAQIVGKSRKREIVSARHAAMYLSKEFTHRSLKSIGLHYAGRDHSTVIHAVKAVEARLETEPAFRKNMEMARKSIQRRVSNSRKSTPGSL